MGSLYRGVRQLIREYLSFGNEEVTQLKKHLESQRSQLLQLKAARKLRQEQEEQVMLLELRRTLEKMKNVDKSRQEQEVAMVEAVGHLEQRMKKVMEADLHQKAANILGAIDYQHVLTGKPSEGAEQVEGSSANTMSEHTTKSQPQNSHGHGRTNRKGKEKKNSKK